MIEGVHLSTGLPSFDQAVRGLLPGDNVVWHVDRVEDYLAFVKPFCQSAREKRRKLVYFRFARHDPLLESDSGAEVHELDATAGFEQFIDDVHDTIRAAGRGAYYVFDCLSDLATDWHSDQMLGNFFMLTCPYLFDLETLAYFCLLRNYHSSYATRPITDTTQLFIDVYTHGNTTYVHPLKVQYRHSSTMYMLHAWNNETFRPITDSVTNAEVLRSERWAGLEAAPYRLGTWNRAFLEAEEIWREHEEGGVDPERLNRSLKKLLRMMISREDRVLELAEKYLTLGELLRIRRRMIGTGLIGGKSVGMLLARAILRRQDPTWDDLLEPQDSFFIGSDVFYTYLVANGCWTIRRKQRDPVNYLEGAEGARQLILRGHFPENIREQLSNMLDYFGQSPLIVRSSSLLEDNFGNAFAGKYESVFCANQGARERRLEDLLMAVRTVYRSAMSEEALSYRARRGLLDRDEQMGLLVQRVSGAQYGSFFFPQVSGVGFSFNPYVWNENIDPEAGVLRVVFGLGTRAVNRSDEDYTRVISLSAPDRRPESSVDAVRHYAQRKVDLLDFEANHVVTMEFPEVVEGSPGLDLEPFASRDPEIERMNRERSRSMCPWILTFERLLERTRFVPHMRQALETLQKVYDYPVDVEFTANFVDDNLRINLVQCRPLQVKGGGVIQAVPTDTPPERLVLEAQGAVIGQSRILKVDRVIYVRPSVYGRMAVNDRYAVARLIGEITRCEGTPRPECVLLMGPGRWGTTTPSLGVPVSFAEIAEVSAICEIVAMREDLVPEVSLGTHFSSEMIEADILYMALFPERERNLVNDDLLTSLPSRLLDIVPTAGAHQDVVRVLDAESFGDGATPVLYANTLKQQIVCRLEQNAPGE